MSAGIFNSWSSNTSIASGFANRAKALPDPFLTHSSLLMPRTIGDILRWCLVPGSLISMANGTLKPVEEVETGDQVATFSGQACEILQTSVRDVDELITHVAVAGLDHPDLHLKITDNHRVRCVNGRAIGDWSDTSDKSDKILEIPAGLVTVGDYLVQRVYARNGSDTEEGDRRLSLVGAFAAAGIRSSAAGSTWFILASEDDRQRLIRHLQSPELQELRCSDSQITRTMYDGQLALIVESKELYTLINQYIDSQTQQLGSRVFALKSADQVQVLSGLALFSGDAQRVGTHPVFCIREDRLPVALQFMGLVSDYLAVGIRHDPDHGCWWFDTNNCRDRFVNGNYIYRRVTRVSRVDYSGPVYSLHVNTDHTFTANGVTVNNCEHIWYRNGVYARACKRVVGYFLTKVEVYDANDQEKKRHETILNEVLDVKNVLSDLGDDFMCFHGDTRVVTREGIFKIRDLAGKTIDVLSEGGIYRPADFKSFGLQELLEVEFSDGRTVLATPEHQWVVSTSKGGTVRVPTRELLGRRIPRTVAPRPEKNDDYFSGVRHGLVFGNGSDQDAVKFHGGRRELLTYFDGCPLSRCSDGDDDDTVTLSGLPVSYKFLPANTASASYWYGFICGFTAVNGSVDDTYGHTTLARYSGTVIEKLAEQLPRVGMAADPVRRNECPSSFFIHDDSTGTLTGDTSSVTLLAHQLLPDDFLLSEHRDTFDARSQAANYRNIIGVKGVHKTGLSDEVFCAVEMDTHTFVIENGILTGNCYGNSFSSVYIPFKRMLPCSSCRSEAPINRASVKLVGNELAWNCPQCQAKCHGKPTDRRLTDESRMVIKRWSPHEIRIMHHPISNEKVYLWDPPATIIRKIKAGDPFYLESMPWEMIDAILNGKFFQFERDVVFHMAEEALSGVDTGGWGLSQIVNNFAQCYYIQLGKLYNEVLFQEYIIPFRVISPAAGPTQARDPLLHTNIGSFNNKVLSMLNEHRRNPGGYYSVPFPIEYQALGAEGATINTYDHITAAMDELLNAVGIPVELYKGTLSIQAMPTALRLFEQTWPHLSSNFNKWLSWLMKTLASAYHWDQVKARLQPVTWADDAERRNILLQMMAANKISTDTVLAPLGVNSADELDKIMQERRESMDAEERFNQEMLQKQMLSEHMQSGAAAAGAGAAGIPMPGMGGGQGGAGMPSGPGVTPDDMMMWAEQTASQLLTMPYESRRSEMLKIKKSDETLHALVKSKLDDIRSQAKSQGGQQVIQQMAQQQSQTMPPAA